MNILPLILAAIAGYLLGCIPTGIVIAKAYASTDIRKTGSGNSGTTNVLRTLGWLPSILTLAGDCVKGLIATLLGKALGGEVGMLVGGLCAVLGHDFPVFLKFKGGKGIATSLGVTLVVCPAAAAWLVPIVLGIVAVVRMMSVGSLAAAVLYPILHWILFAGNPNRVMYLIFSIVMALLATYCHRSNIQRLVKGEENRLNFSKINEISKKYMLFRRKK